MHLLYVDESGDDGFCKNGTYYKPTPTKTFIRTGLVIHDWKWSSINNEIIKFKYHKRIPVTVELHATEILSGSAKSYKRNGKRVTPPNWFGRQFPSKLDRIQILKDACDLITNLPVTLIGVIIDKNKIDMSVNGFKQIPKSRSWEFLIERYNLFLHGQNDKKGTIISDAVENGIEKQHREFAKDIYQNSSHVKDYHFIESILFEPSESSNLLQIVDIASYAFGRKYNYNDDTYFNIIENKIFSHNGTVEGRGLKIWPE